MLVFEHLDVEDGGPTAGRSGKLTTGNINWNIMFHLIFRAATDRPGCGTAHRIIHALHQGRFALPQREISDATLCCIRYSASGSANR